MHPVRNFYVGLYIIIQSHHKKIQANFIFQIAVTFLRINEGEETILIVIGQFYGIVL